MTIKVTIIPGLKDNYYYLLLSPETEETALVDCGEADPVLAKLNELGLKLDYLFSTHHHWDHTDGNLEIKENTGCKIIGFKEDAERIPGIDIKLSDGETFNFAGEEVQITHIPGHTTGAISFYFPKNKMLFTGDTLFSMGCGRLFEGTPEIMLNSLQKIKSLPDDILIYCGHEYSLKNAEFSLTIKPKNTALQKHYEEVKNLREKNLPTIPTTLALEKQINPFLRTDSLEKFTQIRELRNNF